MPLRLALWRVVMALCTYVVVLALLATSVMLRAAAELLGKLRHHKLDSTAPMCKGDELWMLESTPHNPMCVSNPTRATAPAWAGQLCTCPAGMLWACPVLNPLCCVTGVRSSSCT